MLTAMGRSTQPRRPLRAPDFATHRGHKRHTARLQVPRLRRRSGRLHGEGQCRVHDWEENGRRSDQAAEGHGRSQENRHRSARTPTCTTPPSRSGRAYEGREKECRAQRAPERIAVRIRERPPRLISKKWADDNGWHERRDEHRRSEDDIPRTRPARSQRGGGHAISIPRACADPQVIGSIRTFMPPSLRRNDDRGENSDTDVPPTELADWGPAQTSRGTSPSWGPRLHATEYRALMPRAVRYPAMS